jgi:hypothetical protein
VKVRSNFKADCLRINHNQILVCDNYCSPYVLIGLRLCLCSFVETGCLLPGAFPGSLWSFWKFAF